MHPAVEEEVLLIIVAVRVRHAVCDGEEDAAGPVREEKEVEKEFDEGCEVDALGELLLEGQDDVFEPRQPEELEEPEQSDKLEHACQPLPPPPRRGKTTHGISSTALAAAISNRH